MNGPVQPALSVSGLVKPQGLGKTRGLVVSELEISTANGPSGFYRIPAAIGRFKACPAPALAKAGDFGSVRNVLPGRVEEMA